jgi:hypothetical protein
LALGDSCKASGESAGCDQVEGEIHAKGGGESAEVMPPPERCQTKV